MIVMNNPDLIVMIGNVSQSLFAFRSLIAGFGYILGIIFFLIAISKFKKIGESRASHERMLIPIAYTVGGALLLFLPSALSSLSNTFFGMNNLLEYVPVDNVDIYSSMELMLRFAGLLWFIRGTVLIMHASTRGTKDGVKGLMFLIAGILSLNFDNTVSFLSYGISNISGNL
jgi:hypothetical protein